jgi:hypothetical protein
VTGRPELAGEAILEALRPLVAELAAALAVELREWLAEPDVLDVGAVQLRYGLSDPRAARAVMHEAGAFHFGRRLFVRLEDVRRLEAQRVRRSTSPAPSSSSTSTPRSRRAQAKPARLERGFWRG